MDHNPSERNKKNRQRLRKVRIFLLLFQKISQRHSSLTVPLNRRNMRQWLRALLLILYVSQVWREPLGVRIRSVF